MKIAVIVQARMNSTRLPGKVMKEIDGKPLLGYLLERLEECVEVDKVYVACPYDDCHEMLKYVDCAVAWPAIPENDVAGRFVKIAETGRPKADAICRVCADSPLLDPSLVDDACEIYRELAPDFVMNVRSAFPRGQQVEVFSTKLLKSWYPYMTAEEKEHVTLCWTKDLTKHACIVFRPGTVADPPSFLVDTPEDFTRMERLVHKMDKPHTEYGWKELCELDGGM